MFYQSINLKLRRTCFIFTVLAVLFLSFIPSAFAIPGTSTDVPGNVSKLGWVDLSATVPEGFTGSVSVHIRNTDNDSYYDIESFVLNDFKNSAQVPLGNYVVEAVSTSEDPFLYDVSCNIEEFTLTNSFVIHVKVSKNAAGEGFLAGDVEIPDTESDLESDSKSEELLTGEVEEVLAKLDKEVSDESSETIAEVDETTDADFYEESNAKGNRPFWQDIVITVVGVLVFAGIFFGIYFFSRRKYR